MATYTFTGAIAWNRLGSFVTTTKGLTSKSIKDPSTGNTPAGLTQGGVAVTQITTTGLGGYTFSTTDVLAVQVDFGAGVFTLTANELPNLLLTAAAPSNTAIDNRVKWQPTTAYALGQQVLSPNNDVVKANVAHTSSAAYATDVAKWDLTTSFVRKDTLVFKVGTNPGEYSTVQAAHDAAPAGSVVLLPPGNTTHTTPISITKSITLRGNSMYDSRIVANGCNGIQVAAGVTDFRMENVEVACATRYTTTTNALVGIKVAGTTGSRPFNHTYRDVYVDGFWTAFQSCYLWASNFDNFRTDFGLIGIDAYGLSVNNFVGHSHLTVAQVAGSKPVRLAGQESPTDATAVGSEGWTFHDSLAFGGETGFDIIGNVHVDIHDCIIDFCSQYGIRLRDNGTNFGGNLDAHDNYIAMTGASGVSGIQLGNNVSNAANQVNRIHDNHLVVYSGGTCANGIQTNGTQSQSLITENTLKGFTIDITLQCDGSTVLGNSCLSTPGASGNIYNPSNINHVSDNDGIVYLAGGNPNVYSMDALGKKVWLGLQAHTSGTHAWGDRVRHARPAVGSPKAWVCTVAGSPGTWVSEGNL